MKIVHRHRHGFALRPMRIVAEPHAFHYLSQRASFWIAALSVIAFVAGNMMGQYGWHTFWASVLGRSDDSIIVYSGTETPIALVPDYARWLKYGGSSKDHTYAQVPKDVLVPLPSYTTRTHDAVDDPLAVYSMGHLGSYATGDENTGSHVGVDIRVPIGTPVRSVMNGIVERVDSADRGGLGIMVMIRHPNVPDPSNPRVSTTLHSVYGHLNSATVEAGMVVTKGDQIGYSGRTGFASGPHLHFQIDRDEAPWHPYWPFTGQEQRMAGLSFVAAVDSGLNQSEGRKYTVQPMAYVQSNFAQPRTTIVSADPTVLPEPQKNAVRSSSVSSTGYRIALVDRGLQRRGPRVLQPSSRQSSSVHAASPIISRSTVVTASPSQPIPSSVQTSYTIEISHDGNFTGRTWEKVRIRILDDRGEVVRNPSLPSDLYLRTAFGEAEFRPTQLSELDFDSGVTTIEMLPRGRRTVIIEAKPYGVMSKPMIYENSN